MRTINLSTCLLFSFLLVLGACSSDKKKGQPEHIDPNQLYLTIGVWGDSGIYWDNTTLNYANYRDTCIQVPDTFFLLEASPTSRYIYDVTESMLSIYRDRDFFVKRNECFYSELQGEVKEFFGKILSLSSATHIYLMDEVTYHPSYKSYLILGMRDITQMKREYDKLFLVNCKDKELKSKVEVSFLSFDRENMERRYTKTDQKRFVSMIYVYGDDEDMEREEYTYSQGEVLAVGSVFEFDEEGYLKLIPF